MPTPATLEGIKEQIAMLENMASQLEEAEKYVTSGEVDFKFYVHSGKDGNYDTWSEQLDGNTETEAARTFAYTGYEVELSCKVDMETGIVHAYAVNGVATEEPVRI